MGWFESHAPSGRTQQLDRDTRYPWLPKPTPPMQPPSAPQQPTAPSAPTAPPSQQAPSGRPWATPTKDWTRDQVRGYVRDFYASRGVAPNPTSIDYWTDKFFSSEFNGDIDYWMGRLGQADEFTGHTGAAGSGGNQGLGLDSPLLKGFGETFNYNSDDVLNSKAFQAALARGKQALERSAAAKGTILTGGMLKDLHEFGTTFALDAIQDDYNRKLGGMEFNRGTLWGNTDRQFQRLRDFTQLGQSGANQVGGYGDAYGGATDGLAGAWAGAAADQGQAEASGQVAKGWAGQSGNSLNAFAASPVDWSFLNRRRA